MYYSILLCGYGSAGKYVSLVAEDSGSAYIKAVFDPNKEKKAEAKDKGKKKLFIYGIGFGITIFI